MSHIPHIPLKYSLFTKKRFLPIFLAQFLGAFNDNLIRSGLVVLITYADSKGITLSLPAEVLVTICSALLVIPFLIFSSIAGPMADKYEKGRLVTYTKLAEVLIMAVAAYGFSTQDVHLLMVMLFISGTHSTFFSPIKYSILPEHLKDGELLAGNGFIAGGSYLGILFGLICGGLLVEVPGNVIGYTAIAIAFVGLFASLLILRTHPAAPDMPISFNIVSGTIRMIGHARRHHTVIAAIIGLSWFLLQGSVFMAQFSNYARFSVNANNEVYTLFLTVFSMGIAAGAVICDKILKGQISPRLSPITLFGVSVFTYLMVLNTPVPTHHAMLDVAALLSNPAYYAMLLSMLMVAVCGGVYMVPLYAMLQYKSESSYRSQVIAASNVSDSLFMTVAALVSAILLHFGVSITNLFMLMASLNLFVALYAFRSVRDGAFS